MVLNSDGYAVARPIKQTIISGASSLSDLFDRLDAAFENGGWIFNSAIGGGKRFIGISPQNYTVFLDLKIAAPFGFNCIQINLKSTHFGTEGNLYVLEFDPTFTYRVICYPGSFYISRPGIGLAPRGSAICGGIPRVASSCSLDSAQSVVDVWFSFGDGRGIGTSIASNPRINIDHGSDLIINQCGCFNGVLAPINSTLVWDSVQILRLSSAGHDESIHAYHPTLIDGSDIVYPAFISWPTSNLTPHVIRGQLWNAAVFSSTKAPDVQVQRDGYTWLSYTSNYFYGTLMLMTDISSQFGNVVF